ncbi:MAG: Uma2 family endonuclease [Acidobacteria bacterium]|nr:Uma2 family endonuclease [Acidobacteriota bacterium]
MREDLTVPASTPLVTAEEYLRMPDEDGFITELVKGRVIRMPPPGPLHGAVTVLAGSVLHQFVKEHGLGRVLAAAGFKLESDPDTVRGPDVSFIRRERIATTGLPVAYLPGAPDLAVEVLSPSNRRSVIQSKIEQYLELGTRLVWVLDPRARTLTVHAPDRSRLTLAAEDEVTGENVLPGFRCQVGRFFEDL